MDARENFFGRAAGINHPHPIWFAFGKFEETLADLAVKLRRFIVKPALAGRALRVPGMGAGQRRLGVHIEDQGQIRIEPAGGEPVEPRHLVPTEAAHQALVDER